MLAEIKGVQSRCGDKHVLMLDLDRTDKESAETLVRKHLPEGIYLVLRSSEGSYHICSLNLFSRSQIIDIKAGIRLDDPNHLKTFIREGRNVLRISDKGSKDKPKLLDVVNTKTERLKVSKNHHKLFKELYSHIGLSKAVMGEVEWIDKELTVDTYYQHTDGGDGD